MMNILLDRPGEMYFSQAKLVRSKYKTCNELSAQAFEFFKVFLEHKKNFVKPTTIGHYRPYNILANTHSDWIWQSFTEETIQRMMLRVIDFCNLLGIEKKESSTIDNPFFVKVMTSLCKAKKPSLEKVPSWTFICGDEKE